MSGHPVVETHGKESLFFSKNGQNLVYSGQKNDGIKTYGGDREFWTGIIKIGDLRLG